MMAASANEPSLKQKVLTEPGPQTTTDGCAPACQLKIDETPLPSSAPEGRHETILMEPSASRPALKHKVLQESDPTTTADGCAPAYQLELEDIQQRSGTAFRLYEYGKAQEGIKPPEKVILVVGATGAGKTTLINSLINYVFGVEYADNYRLKLISETTDADRTQSQTQLISAYTLHHQEGFKVPYTLTIIDTPGFGDTKGVKRDKEITKQMHAFFKESRIVDHIDVVGFVGQALLERLTVSQAYIFDSILSLFGKDISNNIFLLLTFCDSQKPIILSAMKGAGIPHKGYFKFNNSGVFPNTTSGDDESGNSNEADILNKMFWGITMKQFQMFTTELENIKPQTISQTQEVLEQRCLIEEFIEVMDVMVHEALVQLTRLRTIADQFQEHEEHIEEDKDFKDIEVEVMVERKDIVEDNSFKTFMNGVLTVVTFRLLKLPPTYRKTMEREKRKLSLAQIKTRYEKAQGKKMTVKQVIGAIKDELESIQKPEYKAIDEIRKCLNTLKEIALKPTLLSTAGYIDVMIETEKRNPSEGWQGRVNELEEIKKNSEILCQFGTEPAIRNSEEMDPEEEKVKEKNPSSNEPIASPQIEKRFRCRLQ